MIDIKRSKHNPILSPNSSQPWQAKGTFNGCPIVKDNKTYLLYRAQSKEINYKQKQMELSTIGIAESKDGINFKNSKQFIGPSEEWDKYGCEDPRIVKYENDYYIFYTAISNFPPDRNTIKVGLAISKDLKTISSKHLITPFNAKAMTLFPEQIDGKVTAILTAQTDQPPANVAIAQTKKVENLWNPEFWDKWYKHHAIHTLRLQRRPQDHVEIGSPPVKTNKGWLLIYCYINNYTNNQKKIFTIEAMLLDLKNPNQIIGRSKFPLLIPEKEYELQGNVPNIVFPSGGLIRDDKLEIYYGGADTYCCLAKCPLNNLLEELTQ